MQQQLHKHPRFALRRGPAQGAGLGASTVLALGLILSCGRSGSSPPSSGGPDQAPADVGEEEPTAPSSADPSTPVASPPPGEEPAAEPAGGVEGPSPASLYAECRDRVEGREKDGECSTDADCAKAGCSGEVCVTAALAPEVMTTCEGRPCFAVLETCGCVEGRCSWSLTDTVPEGMEGTGAVQLPAQGGAPAGGGGSDLPQ